MTSGRGFLPAQEPTEASLAPAARDQPAEHGEVGPSQQTNRPSQHREAAVDALFEVVEALVDVIP